MQEENLDDKDGASDQKELTRDFDLSTTRKITTPNDTTNVQDRTKSRESINRTTFGNVGTNASRGSSRIS